MNKYTYKIISFLKNWNINPSINFSNYQNYKTDHIRNIYNSITKSINTKHNSKLLRTEQLKAIKSKNSYPLIYDYYKGIYELNLLNTHTLNIKNIYDFGYFIDWYDTNIIPVNYDNLYWRIEQLEQDQEQDEITKLHNRLFNSNGIRGILNKEVYNNTFIGLDIHQYIETNTK
jgi:hypothetical protein